MFAYICDAHGLLSKQKIILQTEDIQDAKFALLFAALSFLRWAE